VNRLNKDLKSENQALQNRVSIQEKEIEELRAKVDSKGNSDPRLQERDLNLY
jgi:predicted RNase H-like nuclease (RuvC/YqgF family)